MPRLIEIALFLAPFVAVAIWRLGFPGPRPPRWLVWAMGGIVALMVVTLFWMRAIDAEDPQRSYVPAQLKDGHILPPRSGDRP